MRGREVLIKVVLQSILSYLMNVFYVPTSLRDELKSIMLQFWWGSSKRNRKIDWIKWNKVCLPKKMGGIGFCDL